MHKVHLKSAMVKRIWRNWQHRHRSAPGGRGSEVRMAQRSKLRTAPRCTAILGTARVTRTIEGQNKLNICGYGGTGSRARVRFQSGHLGAGSIPVIRTKTEKSEPNFPNRKRDRIFQFIIYCLLKTKNLVVAIIFGLILIVILNC